MQAGPFKTTQTLELFSTSIFDAYKTYNETLRTTFNNSVTTYNELKDAYNTKAELENARNADSLRLFFEQEYLLPQRPCKPAQPPVYSGPVFTFTASDW